MSVAWDIVQAVETAVKAVSMEGLGPLDVFVRDEAVRDTDTEQAPSVVVVGEDEEMEEEDSNGRVLIRYPVLILTVQERGHTPEHARWRKGVREAIRRALYVTRLPGVDSLCNVEYDPRPSFDDSTWSNSYKVRGQRFVWTSDEARND